MKHSRISLEPVPASCLTSTLLGRLIGLRSLRDRFLAILLAIFTGGSVVLSPSIGPGDRRANSCVASCIVQPCDVDRTAATEVAAVQGSGISNLLVTVALQTAAFIEDYYPYDYFTDDTDDLDDHTNDVDQVWDTQPTPFSELADESDDADNDRRGWYEEEDEEMPYREMVIDPDETNEMLEAPLPDELATTPEDDSWLIERGFGDWEEYEPSLEKVYDEVFDDEDSMDLNDDSWLETEAYDESDDESLGEEAYDNREGTVYDAPASGEVTWFECDWYEDYGSDVEDSPSADEWSREADAEWTEEEDRDVDYFDYEDEWNDSDDMLEDGERSQADQAEEEDPSELFLQHETSWSEEDDWPWAERAGAYDQHYEDAEDNGIEDPVWDNGNESGWEAEETSEREVSQAQSRESQNPSLRQYVPAAQPKRNGSGMCSRWLTAVTSEQLIVTDRQLLEELERLSKASAWVRRIAMDDYLVSLGSEVMRFVAHFESATGEDVLDWSQNASSAAAFLASYRLYEQGLAKIDEAVELAEQIRNDLPWKQADYERSIATQTTLPTTPAETAPTVQAQRYQKDLVRRAADWLAGHSIVSNRTLRGMSPSEPLSGALAASLSGGRSAWLWWFWDRLVELSGIDWRVAWPGRANGEETAAYLLDSSARQR